MGKGGKRCFLPFYCSEWRLHCLKAFLFVSFFPYACGHGVYTLRAGSGVQTEVCARFLIVRFVFRCQPPFSPLSLGEVVSEKITRTKVPQRFDNIILYVYPPEKMQP